MQLILEPRHGRGTRHVLPVMNEHRSVEIDFGEHLGDVVHVQANRVPAFAVLYVVGPNVDHAAIVVQFEVVRGLLM